MPAGSPGSVRCASRPARPRSTCAATGTPAIFVAPHGAVARARCHRQRGEDRSTRILRADDPVDVAHDGGQQRCLARGEFGLGEAHRCRHLRHVDAARVRHVPEHAARLHLRVLEHVGEVIAQQRRQLGDVPHPLRVGRAALVLRPAGPAEHLAQPGGILEESSGQVEEWLADERIDIAILDRYGASPPDAERALASVDSFLIGAPRDAPTKQATVPFGALHGLPFILPGAPNGLRNALDLLARLQRIALEPVIEAGSLPLMKSLVERERLYTVLPLHTVWDEVQQGRLQAARLVDPPSQRSVSKAAARSKSPARAVAMVAAQIVRIVDDMARHGLWHSDPAG